MTGQNSLKRMMAAAIAITCMLAAPAFAEDAAHVASPADGAMFDQSGAIVLEVSSAVSQERYNNFFLQFDGDDITSLVAVSGRTVNYKPPQQLSPGAHELKLIEKTQAGKFKDLGHWIIRVPGNGTKDASLDGNLQAQYNYLAADNVDGPDQPQRHSAHGVGTVTGSVGEGAWNTTATANGFFDTKQTNNKPDEDNLELGEYLVTSGYYGIDNSAVFRIGNHDPGVSNLLMDQFYRRGASAYADLGGKLRVTGFAEDPAPAIGNDNPSGVGDPSERAAGVFVKGYPLLSTYGQRVSAEAGMYAGEGTTSGNGSGVIANPDNRGTGWVAALEGQTLDDKINLRGDYAETGFDEDGNGILSQKTTDQGYRARLLWSPIATLAHDDASPQKWLLGLTYQDIGTYFRALTNIGLPMDEKRLTLSSLYSHDTLNTVLEGYTVENNVDDVVFLPTDRGYGAHGTVAVTPAYFRGDIAPESFLGRSVLTANAGWTHERRVETPATFLGDGLNQATFTAGAGWTVAYEKFTASLNHTYSVFDDNAVATDSYHTNFSEASVSWLATDWLTVTPALQMQLRHDKPEHQDAQYFGAIDLATTIIPDKLTNTFHYSALLDQGGEAENQDNLSTEFDWQLRQPGINVPGITLALAGNYFHGTPPTVTPLMLSGQDEEYKVYLSLKISAPFRWQ